MTSSKSVNKKQQSSSLIEGINSLNVFGKCQPEDLVFSEHEKKQREKNFIKAQIERKKEEERQERLRKEQEIADRKFLEEEERRSRGIRRNEKTYYTPPKARGRGRGYHLSETLKRGDGSELGFGRGRGHLSPQERECLSLFDREEKVLKNINQFTDSNLYNNKVQKRYWQGFDQEEGDFNCYTPDSSSTSDQYEDAFDSPEPHSPESWRSVQSRPSGSPASTSWPCLEPVHTSDDLTFQPRAEATPASQRPLRKPRGSRLAAKFENSLEEDNSSERKPNNNYQWKETSEIQEAAEESRGASGSVYAEEDYNKDTFEFINSSGSRHGPCGLTSGRRSGGISINCLRPSQRILSNNVLRPEELRYSDYVDSGASNEFSLNMKDFPAL